MFLMPGRLACHMYKEPILGLFAFPHLKINALGKEFVEDKMGTPISVRIGIGVFLRRFIRNTDRPKRFAVYRIVPKNMPQIFVFAFSDHNAVLYVLIHDAIDINIQFIGAWNNMINFKSPVLPDRRVKFIIIIVQRPIPASFI